MPYLLICVLIYQIKPAILLRRCSVPGDLKSLVKIDGSCLCGSAKYTISGGISDIVHCHCVTCRKAHGAAFSSVASVPLSSFTLNHTDPLGRYESSPGKTRYFCSNCGTHLYAKRTGQDHIILRLGSIDSELPSREYAHIWLSHKASWYELNSELKECQDGI